MAKHKQPIDYYGDEFNDEIESDLIEEDILDLCGDKNSLLGKAFYQRKFVSQRSFDGQAIHATIQDGNSNIPVVFDLQDESASCTDQRHLRKRDLFCEHIAALMWAYMREPDSFLPQNIGGFLDLLNKNPQAREQLVSDPRLNQMLDQIQKLPPRVRDQIINLPINATPEQVAPLAALNTPEEELKSLMRNLTIEQLREIAKRRKWKLSGNAKEPIIDELVSLLATMPLPSELTPEEEQLLRIENTLYGLQDVPEYFTLQSVWRARAGGDMKRFELAVRGLQSAGVLFPCTEQGSALYYHWSPFLRTEEVPHLATKVKLFPAEKIGQLKQAEPLMPLTTIVDAVLELAEREPLHIRPIKTDPRLANQPLAQGWELDSKEIEQFAKLRYFPNNAITITFPFFWISETQQKLDAISPQVAKWIAAFILGGKFLVQDGEYARVDSEQARLWRADSDEGHWRFLWLGWRAGAVAMTELRVATERASLVAQRSTYARDFTPPDLLVEIANARNFIARLLTPLDPLTWYSFKSFAEYVRGLRPDFLHTTTTQDTWILAASKTQHRFDPNNTQNWDSSYRAVLAAFLETTLRWLGVTEVAYEGKELAAFRITALGASMLSGGKISVANEPADPNAPPITWVDDSTIRLRATPEAAKAMSLIRSFADPGRESLAFRVTNASIARALERGVTIDEIADKMNEAGAPLPDALRNRFDALAANYGRTHVYEGLTVIELTDDFALRELLASTSLSQFMVHQFSPRLVVVRDENVDEWMNEIVKKGYTPRIVT